MMNGRPPQTSNLPHPVLLHPHLCLAPRSVPRPLPHASPPAPCLAPSPLPRPPSPVPHAHKALTLWWRKIPAQRLSGR